MGRLYDGFSTRISFADNPTVLFYEMTVTPPGVQGGGENDTTTMRNTSLRTRMPKKLKTMSPMSATVAYDPQALDDCFAMVNVNQLITVEFSDGSTWQFWGWLDELTPGEITEGAQPEADVTIIPSNMNDSQVETAPIFTAAP